MNPAFEDEDRDEELMAALMFVGLRGARSTGKTSPADFIITARGGLPVAALTRHASLISADSVHRQLAKWNAEAPSDAVLVVVADRITADARTYLTRKDCSWLDLRGHLRLTAPGIIVDTDVPVARDFMPEREGFTGLISMELATLLLLDPSQAVGVRAAAASLARAPSSVSVALRALRAADLIDAEGRPRIPELFWETASRWRSISRDVATLPGLTGRESSPLRLGLDNVASSTGWALTDTAAARAYGARMALRADHPVDFYVPDRSTLRRATQLLGDASSPQARVARIHLAPVSAVCARRIDPDKQEAGWPLAHPVFVALDLAQDSGRGHEFLEDWTPKEPWHRVW